jgi:hypothetical protein
MTTGQNFAGYWLDPETDVLGTAANYYAPNASDSSSAFAMKIAGLATAGTVLAVPTAVAVGCVAGIEELKHFPHTVSTLINGMSSAGKAMDAAADQVDGTTPSAQGSDPAEGGCETQAPPSTNSDSSN